MAQCINCGRNEDNEDNIEIKWHEDTWMCEKCIFESKSSSTGAPRRPRGQGGYK